MAIVTCLHVSILNVFESDVVGVSCYWNKYDACTGQACYCSLQAALVQCGDNSKPIELARSAP